MRAARGSSGAADSSVDARRALPAYAWLGLVAMTMSEAGMFARVEPFYSWHTPIAWTGYILFVDGLVWRRRGHSLIRNAAAELGFMSVASVLLWLVFEAYNACCIQNWYYVGLPESRPVRYFGYVWAFATIWPAIFETGELFASFRADRQPAAGAGVRRAHPLGPMQWASIAAGTAMLALPIVYPSQYLAAPVWLGFIFLLDPLNARAGDESILGDLREGRRGRLLDLMAAGLVCGVLWEFWNYWAGSKWHYDVPILENIRMFEMPVLGYGGFPPFALECFTMYVFLRRWVWRGARRPISV